MFQFKNRSTVIVISIIGSLTVIAAFVFLARPTAQPTIPTSTSFPDEEPGRQALPIEDAIVPTTGSEDPKTTHSEPVADFEEIFLALGEKSSDPNGVIWADFANTQEKGSPTIKDLFRAEPGSYKDRFLSYMSPNDFDIFRCGREQNSPRGIYFTVIHQPEYTGNYYADAIKALEAWQPYIFNDTADILFPEKALAAKAAGHPIDFDASYSSTPGYEADYRGATLMIDGKQIQIYYGIVMNNIVITSSKTCLLSVSSGLFDLVP